MSLERLLVVQAHDSAIDLLEHRRTTLPELQALADCDDERAHLEAALSDVAERRHVLEREQKRLEDDIALIQDRRDSENERLYSGTVTAHKDLQAIQDELRVLTERQSGLEDEVLELFEQMDPIDTELEQIDTKLGAVATRRDSIEAALIEAQSEIDDHVSEERQARSEAADGVDAALLSDYERLRAAKGGVGVARLNGKTCEGCHLQLSAVDYDRIRKEPADAAVHCPECQRILVRS